VEPVARAVTSAPAAAPQAGPPATTRRKLSYKEQRELAGLPGLIEELEGRQRQLERVLSAPGFYQSPPQELQRVTGELADVQRRLEQAFERWTRLDSAG
jgi:ABC transport system ATP-binding/permease protein